MLQCVCFSSLFFSSQFLKLVYYMLEPCNWEKNNEASKFSLARSFLLTRQSGKNFYRLYVLASVFFLGTYYIVATLLAGWKILMSEISFYSFFIIYISCAAQVRETRRPIFRISGLQDLETRFSSLGAMSSFFSFVLPIRNFETVYHMRLCPNYIRHTKKWLNFFLIFLKDGQ